MSARAAVSLAMRRLAALFTFSLLAAGSTLAHADEPPERSKKESGKESEKKSAENKGSDEKKNCSVSDEDDAMLGLAALALLISSVVLRRRKSL
jgi:hypothetical protein